jgi:putative endonuclease
MTAPPDARVKAERRGRLAESICVARLRLSGWRILARRMKGGRGSGLGEIDIVARRGNMVAFIEVKARANSASAAEAVTAQQQARIARSAEVYLQRHAHLMQCDVRFDVMLLGQRWLPRHIADAWRP